MTGRSAPGLALEIVAAMLSKRRFRPDEFFLQGAWRGSPQQRAAYVSATAGTRLNHGLMAPAPFNQQALIADKYLTGLVLESNGFPTPRLHAAFAVDRPFGGLHTLSTQVALAAWIADATHLPVFAKPVDGSQALGSVPLLPGAPEGMVDLGGPIVSIADLAAEVAQVYQRGWLLQDLILQPPAIEALIGPGVGTVRLVTLWEDGGPEAMYGVWRHPVVGGRVDAASHGKPNIGCALDVVSGEITQAQYGDLFTGRDITHSVVTPDLPLVGFRLPDWPRLVQICCAAHRLFPAHALLGWDIGMSRNGPIICEVNTNPMHASYQRAHRRGILQPAFRARFDRARQVLARRMAGYRSIIHQGTP